jgi:hypothetical protein
MAENVNIMELSIQDSSKEDLLGLRRQKPIGEKE